MLVSICIPTFHHPDILKKCLDSIVIQDFKDFEIVVSDDSRDLSVKSLLDSYKFSALSYFKNSTPLGSPLNWNNAIKHAKGKYVKIMHHDDYFTKADSLRKFVVALDKNPDACFAFSYSNIYFRKEDVFFVHKQTKVQLKRLKENTSFLFFRNIIGAPSATIFRNDPALLFGAEYIWLVDVEFYIRYLKAHEQFIAIPEPLITVVDGVDGQITQAVSNDKTTVIREHLQLFSQLYPGNFNAKKASLYFQELFLRFGILSAAKLQDEFKVPGNIHAFMNVVFEDFSKHTFLKRIKKKLLNSRYNKRIFKIERF